MHFVLTPLLRILLFLTILPIAINCNQKADTSESADAVALQSWPEGPFAYYKVGGSSQTTELFAKPLKNKGARKISNPWATDIGDKIIADSQKDKVYFVQKDSASKWHLYRCDMKNKGKKKKLNHGGNVDSKPENLHRDQQNDRLYYIADQHTADQFELYMIDLSNENVSVKLNAPLAAAHDVKSFKVSADGTHALYRVSNGTLWLVAINNATVATQVANPGSLMRYDFSLDSTKIIFVAFVNNTFSIDLLVSTVADPASWAYLTPPADAFSYQFLPGTNNVIYTAREPGKILDMFVVSLTNNAVSTMVHPPMVSGGGIFYDLSTFNNETINDPISISPDGSKVLYVADMQTQGTEELFVTDLSNLGSATKVNSTLVSNGDVTTAYQWMPDSNGIIYVADQDTDGVNELYYVTANNPTITTRLNAALVAGGNVSTTGLSIIGNDVYYTADQHTDELFRTYKVNVFNPGVVSRVDEVPEGDSRTIQRFVVSY